MKPTHFGVKSLLFFAAITGAFYAAPYVNLFFLLMASQYCQATFANWACTSPEAAGSTRGY